MKKEHLSESVKNCIRTKIRSGEWISGEKLPAERALAELFGVSRTVLREALRDLTAEHVLEQREGKTYVRPLSFVEMTENLALTVEPGEELTAELLDVSRVLANEIVKVAARRWDGSKEEQLRDCMEAMETRILQGSEMVSENWEFMELLAEVSGNKSLGSLYHMCRVVIARSIVRPMRKSKTRSVAMEAVQNYKTILGAVKNQDSIEAVRLMNSHEQFVSKLILQNFQKDKK